MGVGASSSDGLQYDDGYGREFTRKKVQTQADFEAKRTWCEQCCGVWCCRVYAVCLLLTALRTQKVWQQLRRWDEATGTSAMMLAMLVAVRQQGVTMKRGAALWLAGATG